MGLTLPSGAETDQHTGSAIAVYLVLHGADVNFFNHEGKTPLDLCPNPQTVNLIQKFARRSPRYKAYLKYNNLLPPSSLHPPPLFLSPVSFLPSSRTPFLPFHPSLSSLYSSFPSWRAFLSLYPVPPYLLFLNSRFPYSHHRQTLSTRPATFTQPRPQPVLSRSTPPPPVTVRGNGPSPAVSTVPRPPQPAAATVCDFVTFAGVLQEQFRTRTSFEKHCQTLSQWTASSFWKNMIFTL